MIASGPLPSKSVRRRLVESPADQDAWCDSIRETADNRRVFNRFRRLAVLTVTPDGDVLRKAIEATRAVDGPALSRFANSGAFAERLIVPFVATSMLVNARLDIAKIAATPYQFASMRDQFEKAISLLSNQTIPSSAREMFEIMVGKQHIRSLLMDAGYLAHAAQMSENASAYARWMRKTLYGVDVRGVTDQWTFAIGHMVVLAYLMKGQDSGIFDFKSLKVWQGKVANRFLWEQMLGLSDNVEVVSRGSVFADNHFSRNLEWVDDGFLNYFETCGIVADRAGDMRGAILAPPPRSHPALTRFFEDAAGLTADDRIVTVHCREPGYRVNERQDLRNARIEDYLPALTDLVRRGYRVVRLGDPTMTPLAPVPGVFDYAVSPLKSAELDVLLPAIAEFHIGCSSGLSLVPLLYATPCLFLNWYPFDLLPWGRRNWTVLKPIEALADRRSVVDRQTYATLGLMRERRLLNSFGYDARAMTAGESGHAVAGFVETLQPDRPEPPKAGSNIGRIIAVADNGRLQDLTPGGAVPPPPPSGSA